ncbi:hypothetical protein EYR41_009804 [Orbilia oligospora]|uniref:Uncharacterized protein n=1 Tax=Orbilia oligospora TaxID=2813651 RepID=A0A8H2HLF4_ORBOL|nr:hypothetical protein EYR41_009804 [Orbilia oligospora]
MLVLVLFIIFYRQLLQLLLIATSTPTITTTTIILLMRLSLILQDRRSSTSPSPSPSLLSIETKKNRKKNTEFQEPRTFLYLTFSNEFKKKSSSNCKRIHLYCTAKRQELA